jgi:hypothetical protein
VVQVVQVSPGLMATFMVAVVVAQVGAMDQIVQVVLEALEVVVQAQDIPHQGRPLWQAQPIKVAVVVPVAKTMQVPMVGLVYLLCDT